MKKTRHDQQPGAPADREQLETILNCVADGVFTVDRDKKIRFFNRAAERITGFSAEEATGQFCRDVFRTTICGTSCTLAEVERTGKDIINRPVRILDRDGREVLVSISAAALRDARGELIGGVETFRDLSTEEELRRQIEKSYTFHDIVSRHPKMHELFAILPDIAESHVSVLIEGESGTGKELFARAIHNLSPRKDAPFIAVNCGSLPDTLLESELFGYRKGAFTDAKHDKPGRFEMAKGGTLFLDEISDVSPALQVRLLRVLQEKTYEPLGGTEPVRADVRIVAATNQNLSKKVQTGTFREDLYYRLNVLRLELPPLRERRCDIPILIDHFRRHLNAETGKGIEAVDDCVLNLLMSHDFPGNIRELENIMQHAFVLCKQSVILPAHLPKEFAERLGSRVTAGPLSLEELEKKAIREALFINDGNRTATSKQLGIDPSTLYRKMKRYGMK
ncbi:MAG: sigma 54-interacting transcriptional regulator [Kiritimatiellae bacterium]|nr:sigma 54-interacting transcriptional regulator [Kiritimatiellia bacterium]